MEDRPDFSDEIRAYRRREIEEMAAVVAGMWDASRSPDYLAGALAMAKRILNLPARGVTDEEGKKAVNALLKRDFKEFEIAALRRLTLEE